MTRPLVAFDIETYPNYFLCAFKNIENGKTFYVEAKGGASLSIKDITTLQQCLKLRTIFGFNSRNFDIPLLCYAMSGANTEQLCKVANDIVAGQQGWQVMQALDLQTPDYIDHFDIQEPLPSVNASLKLYGARLHSYKLQELPIQANTVLTPAQMEEIKLYCVNDLDTTIDAYKAVAKDIELHHNMQHLADTDLRSKSGAQVAEAVIVNQLEKQSGKKIYRPDNSQDIVRYIASDFIEFQTTELQTLFKRICDERFAVNNGKVILPDWLAKQRITINNTQYQIGIGGLHSCESARVTEATNNTFLIDADVTSYYPSIILQLGLYPPHLGKAFLSYYETIFNDRIKAKKEGDTLTANAYKLILNSSFGKFGNQYSKLYAPELLLRVTITGQLCLLMLIEALEMQGIEVVSANTDGIVSLIHNKNLYDIECEKWQTITGFNLEFARYKGLYSRDVNNYVAVKHEGGVKGKGLFTLNQLSKNPHADIAVKAVMAYLEYDTPIVDTIYACDDIRQFLIVRTVNGGGQWKGQYLGKVVRFYWCKQGAPITYKKNGNKVPKSDNATPLMMLSDAIPQDVDYQRYVREAEAILASLGLKSDNQGVLL